MTFRVLDPRRATVTAALYGLCASVGFRRHVALSSDGSFTLNAVVKGPGKVRKAVVTLAGRLDGRYGAGTLTAAFTYPRRSRTDHCTTGDVSWHVFAAQPGGEDGTPAAPLAGRAYVGLTNQKSGGPRTMLLHTNASASKVVRAIFEYRDRCDRVGGSRELSEFADGGTIGGDGRFAQTTRYTINYSDLREDVVVRVAGRFLDDGVRGTVNVLGTVHYKRGNRAPFHCGTNGDVRFHAAAPPA